MKAISFCISLLVSISLFAQKDFEGSITYKIEYEDLSEDMEAVKFMLPTQSTTQVKNGIAKSVSQKGMSQLIVLSNSNTGEIIMLNSAMGKKAASKMTTSDVKKEESDGKISIEYTNETKVIQGYTCKKAIATTSGSVSQIYYTNELPSISTNGQPNGIDGFPMQIIIKNKLFKATNTVSEIKKENIDPIQMEIPDDYSPIPISAMKKLIGEM